MTVATKPATASKKPVKKPAPAASKPEKVTPPAPKEKLAIAPADPVKVREPAKISPPRKTSVIPLLAGGVVAGAIGFGAASLYFTGKPADNTEVFSQIEATLGQQQQEMRAAEAKIDALLAAKDSAEGTAQALADFGKQSEQRNAEFAASLNAVSQSIVAIEARLLTLEKRPIAEAGGMTSEAAAAFERDMALMREMLAAQRAEIEQMAADVAARIEGAAQKAATMEETADAKANEASLRAAMSQLQTAMDRGGAFEASLADLAAVSEVEIPPVLTRMAKTGVPTLASLQKSFPDAARTALAASVTAKTGDGTMDKLGAFLRTQVGARSLEPREGNDPDAVLSRAEAALKDGELDVTLALVGALPSEGKAAMSDWIAQARARDGAVRALRRLAQNLSGN